MPGIHNTPPRGRAGLDLRVRRAIQIVAALAALAIAVALVWKPSAPRDALEASRTVEAPHEERASREEPSRRGSVSHAISGVVRAVAGGPIQQASVCVFDPAEPCCENARCTATNAEGRFTLLERSSTALNLLASAPGYLSKLHELTDDGPVLIALDRGGAAVSGTVVDASGGPIAGAMVTLQPGGAEPPTLLISDARGAFKGQVAAGEIDVLGYAEAYSRAKLRVYAPVAGVTLVLAPAAAIVGRVVNAANDEPLEDVAIVVAPQNPPGDARTGVSDAAGQFRVADLAPGSYTVLARSGRWSSNVHSVELEPAAASAPLVLRMRAATMLTGSVLVDGEPCADAAVELSGSAGTEYQPAASGMVHFEGLPPGDFKAVVRCEGALGREEVITLGGEPLTREWNLGRGLAIAGRVETPQHRPVANARVSVEPVAAALDSSASGCVSDADGKFTCAGLLAGEYECSVMSPFGPASDTQRVVLRAGTTPQVVLVAAAAGSIHVAVRAAEGDGRFVNVLMGGPGGAREATRRVDEFVFDSVPLGAYEIYVDSPRKGPGSSAEARVIRDGEVVQIALEAPALASISGQVVDGQGVPVPDAWVRAASADVFAVDPDESSERRALTDAMGAFTLTGLSPNSYALRARHGTGEALAPAVEAGATNVVLRLELPVALPAAVMTPAGAPAVTPGDDADDVDDSDDEYDVDAP